VLAPLGRQQTGNDAIVITITSPHRSFVLKAEFLEELASATQFLGRQAGDPLTFELIEWVLHDARNKRRRQPIGPDSGKTDLNVAILRLILIENHAAYEVIVLIDYPDSLARTPIQTMPDLIRYPLSD